MKFPSNRNTERRIPDTLIIVIVSEINHRFITNQILLHQTNLTLQNFCTFHIGPVIHTIIMGFCTLLEMAVVPADVAGW